MCAVTLRWGWSGVGFGGDTKWEVEYMSLEVGGWSSWDS